MSWRLSEAKVIWSRRTTLVSAAGLAAAASWARSTASSESHQQSAPTARVLGKLSAPNRFSLWGSLTCPYTAELTPILSKIVKDMPSKVALEWHHFPTHPPDPALHVASLAFEKQHFWGFVSDILGAVYAASGMNQFTPQQLAAFAKKEGGSEAMLQAAYADPAKWKAVKDDFLAGKLLGVSLTPGLFYDGYFLTPAGLPLDLTAFDKSLRAMLEKG